MFKFFKKKIVEEKPKNLQLISLCLAYEVANADNEIDDSEKEILLRKIKEAVDVSVVSENEILAIIENESKKKVSFYDLIHDINKNFVKEEKIDILNLLWEIAYADNVLTVDEERLIRRSAEMLGIRPSIVLKAKDNFKD